MIKERCQKSVAPRGELDDRCLIFLIPDTTNCCTTPIQHFCVSKMEVDRNVIHYATSYKE